MRNDNVGNTDNFMLKSYLTWEYIFLIKLAYDIYQSIFIDTARSVS